MMATIGPALTAEEWADLQNAAPERPASDDYAKVQTIAILNHLLPDDDPRKLVAADVAEILSVAAFIEDGTGGYSDGSDLRRIAAKLNSLLPHQP